MTSLRQAIDQAHHNAREETTLRQMVAYAAERGELAVVLRLGRLLDEILATAVIGESVPPSAKPLAANWPPKEMKRKRRRRS